MKITKVWYGLAILLSISIGLFAQSPLGQGINVKLPQAVIVGEKSLPAGEYEIRKESTANTVLRFFNNDKLQYETAAIPIPAETKGEIEDSKVVMEKVGDDLYLTKVWIEGASTGYELPLPERARALKRELAQTVVATRTADHVVSSVSDPAPSSASTPPAASESSANPRTNRDEPRAEIAQNVESEPLQVAQARDVEARPEPAAAQVPAQQSPQAAAPSPAPAPSVAPAQAAPDTLPATASNWAQFLLIGVMLITVAAVILRG